MDAFWQMWVTGGVAVFLLFTSVWVFSLFREDASLVDRFWGLAFVVAAVSYWVQGGGTASRRDVMILLVGIWAGRLSAHISLRNWGAGEDPRYARMRRHNRSSFNARSLVTVFWNQALLATIISAPLLGMARGRKPFGVIDIVAIGIWTVGFVFEAVADDQLARFRAHPDNRGQVMDRGLWRYTRHPNYFGEFTMWWAIWLLAVAAGFWWTAFGPVVMSYLLLRVSGVTLLEKGLEKRKPQYADYIARTNAFFPWKPRPRESE